MELCFTYHVVGLEGVGFLYVLVMVDDGDVSEVGVLEHDVVQVGDVPEVRLGVPANDEQVTRSFECFYKHTRVFHKYTTLAIMSLLASDVLLRENKKKSGNKMLPLVGMEPLAQVSKSIMLLPTLT